MLCDDLFSFEQNSLENRKLKLDHGSMITIQSLFLLGKL